MSSRLSVLTLLYFRYVNSASEHLFVNENTSQYLHVAIDAHFLHFILIISVITPQPPSPTSKRTSRASTSSSGIRATGATTRQRRSATCANTSRPSTSPSSFPARFVAIMRFVSLCCRECLVFQLSLCVFVCLSVFLLIFIYYMLLRLCSDTSYY